ncbi:Predicted lipid-binding transport protein, Tim44 family [Poseidonocella pacifica]|uniref:Predicted lipid-binding transport protein, Tim44 family n=1 Tax=Poseidonocella pacifica TaxID=871651 RepID=A0A1I0XVG2_9RHOB|nr:Tim44/TimA family putative adaptor protein [Poseidonocella pacifica]SFB04647.1 Predicted lipid-binding transport protein, Tim44 family [Poseidonocella pacifica]
MNSQILQLLVLAGIAIFLILRLRSVLGTRDGFEKPPVPRTGATTGAGERQRSFEVIEGGPDRDITDYVAEDSPEGKALAAMKRVEPSFSVSDFLGGARSAYEMILMGFERGDVESLRPFVSADIYNSFSQAVAAREAQGLSVEAQFIGVRETALVDANFDESSSEGEITVRFTGEMTSAVRNESGEIVEGSTTEIKRQKDVWTFARSFGSDDPNWQLVATGE